MTCTRPTLTEPWKISLDVNRISVIEICKSIKGVSNASVRSKGGLGVTLPSCLKNYFT